MSLLGGLVSHLCLALNDLRRFGWSFLILMLASPKRIVLVLSPTLATTTNFLVGCPGVLLGLLYPLTPALANLGSLLLGIIFSHSV